MNILRLAKNKTYGGFFDRTEHLLTDLIKLKKYEVVQIVINRDSEPPRIWGDKY
jgi:hypothetical protein